MVFYSSLVVTLGKYGLKEYHVTYSNESFVVKTPAVISLRLLQIDEI